MNAIKTTIAAIALTASVFVAGPAAAACGDADFNAALQQLRLIGSERGAWINTYMSYGTGRAMQATADQVLAGILVAYTREVLDRGAWGNVWMSAPGYDAGNPLLTVQRGEGVTTRSAPQAPAIDRSGRIAAL